MSGIGSALIIGGASLAGAGISAGMSASGANASKNAARRAAQQQLAGYLSGANQLYSSTKQANKILDPYANLGTGAASSLQQSVLGTPQDVFRPAITIPDYPQRRDFKNANQFNRAVRDWKDNYNTIQQQAAAQGVNLPKLGKFQTVTNVSDGKGGVTQQASFNPSQLKSFISDWNGKESARANNAANLNAQGINADNYTGAMMDKGDMNAAGMQTHAYTLGDYERQFGPMAKAPWQMGLSDFQASPDYQWRLSQGESALQSSAAAKGGLLSSATMKALSDYGQNQGAAEFQNWWNRSTANRQNSMNEFMGNAQNFRAGQGQALGAQMGLLNAGQDASTRQSNNIYNTGQTLANIYTGVGQNAANSQLAQGAAQSNMYRGIGSAIGQGLSTAASLYGIYGGGMGGGDALGGSATPSAGSNGLSLPNDTQGVNLGNQQAYMGSLFQPQSLRNG